MTRKTEIRVVYCLPYSWIVRPKAYDEISLRLYHEHIAPDWQLGKGSMVARVPEAGILLASPDDLEVMAVKMEGMLAGVVIVQHNLYNFAFLEHEGIGVGTVYSRIDGI